MSTDRPSGMRVLGLNVVVALAYGAIGGLSLVVAQFTGLASPVWPAAGMAFAIVYQLGWRLMPGVAVGSFLVNMPVLARGDLDAGRVVTVALAIALGAALQAETGGWFVARAMGRRPSLARGGQILTFLLIAGPGACIINPTIGVTAQLAGGVISPDQAALNWLTWWVGDSIGVMIFAPITLMLLPWQSEVWRGRVWQVVVPSLLAVLVFGAFFLQALTQEDRATRLQVDQLAESASADLRSSLAQHAEALEGLRGLFEASDEVEPQEFTTFAAGPLARAPHLQAMSWNAAVPAADLAAFEDAQRVRPGLAGFTVTERDANGDLVPVTGRDEYVVVTYIEPLATNAAALGFDIASNPVRAEAVVAARDTGVPTGTAPIDLVQESGTQKGMLALLPVFVGGGDPGDVAGRRAALRGFTVGVYRLGDLLADTFRGPQWASVAIRLVDVTAASDEEIAVLDTRRPGTVDAATPEANRSTSEPIDVYGRQWALEVTPTSGPLAASSHEMAPGYLIGGLLVIGLLEAFVLLLTGMERQARRDAASSNFEATHDSLTGLVNRRAFLRQLETTRERAAYEGSVHVLMFLDLDGFKAVNDAAGHETGDDLLRGISDILRTHVRDRDTVARLGGDEFAVILNNCPENRGLDTAQKLVDMVQDFVVTARGQQLSVGVSVGVAVIDRPVPSDVDELMRRADSACYAAKAAGKSMVRAYTAP